MSHELRTPLNSVIGFANSWRNAPNYFQGQNQAPFAQDSVRRRTSARTDNIVA
jgi:signal transduction histidine kinase